MKKVVLDTSFILTCVRQKIDFFEDLYLGGFQILIPKQVIDEIRKNLNSKKVKESENANMVLKLLRNNLYKQIDLKLRNVDNGIIKFANENSDMIIATLDKGIKNKIKNSKLIIRGKKKLEIV